MKTKRKYRSVEEVKRLMARYCAYRERSSYETEKKLNEYGLIPEAKEEILAFLTEENFVDDLRFAKLYARSKFYQNRWGKRKIIQGLKKHRLTDYYIREALKEIDETGYKETIRKLMEKKRKTLENISPAEQKRKIYAYLMQKGYDYDEVTEIWENERK